MRAQLFGHFHGHGGMNAIFAGFVTTGGYHPPVAAAAYQYRLAVQFRIDPSFDRYKEGVEIDVRNGAQIITAGMYVHGLLMAIHYRYPVTGLPLSCIACLLQAKIVRLTRIVEYWGICNTKTVLQKDKAGHRTRCVIL